MISETSRQLKTLHREPLQTINWVLSPRTRHKPVRTCGQSSETPAYNSSNAVGSHQLKQFGFRVLGAKYIQKIGETTKTPKNGKIPLLCKVGSMTTGSHECLAVCLSLSRFNFVKRHTTINFPKTWWRTTQGSRLSSSQRRTCFRKIRPKRALPAKGQTCTWNYPAHLR